MSQRKKHSQSYYDVLRVRPNASAAEIKKSYHALAKSCHPDTAQQNKVAASKHFYAINEAYSHLKNSQDRERYNIKLRAQRAVITKKAENDNSQHKNWLMKIFWPNNKKAKA